MNKKLMQLTVVSLVFLMPVTSHAMLSMAVRRAMPSLGRVAVQAAQMQARAVSSAEDARNNHPYFRTLKFWEQQKENDASYGVTLEDVGFEARSGDNARTYTIPSVEADLANVKDAYVRNKWSRMSHGSVAALSGLATLAVPVATASHFINQGCSLSVATIAALTAGTIGTGFFGVVASIAQQESSSAKAFCNYNQKHIAHLENMRQKLEAKRADFLLAQAQKQEKSK